MTDTAPNSAPGPATGILGPGIRIPTRDELEAMAPEDRAALIKWATPRLVPGFCPVTPHPPQQLFLWMQNLEAFYGGAGGGGKSIALLLAALQYALDVSTPVPTPTGWSTIGDLQPGDKVFDEGGRSVAVTGKSPVFLGGDRFQITLDGRHSLVADGDHLWAAETFNDRMAARRNLDAPLRLVSTREMHRTRFTNHAKKDVNNWSIRLTKPLNLPEADLPIDPYVLGAWLGDGSARDGTMAGIDPEVTEEFRSAGYETTPYGEHQWHVRGLRTQLEELGVRNNKHVPTRYLRASSDQRLALLQGLMDTDGTCDRRWGIPKFSNTNRDLIAGVCELITSLGWSPRVFDEPYRTKVTKAEREIHHVTFLPTTEVFRLPRKASLQKFDTERPLSRDRTRRIVTDIQRVEGRVPVQCITVDSPNKLFLAGMAMVPTHNCDVPGYNALILRRTYADLILPGALMDRARELLQDTTARPVNGGTTWVFPSGARLVFGYAQFHNEIYRYRSSEWQFCVERGTGVKMADGTSRPVETIQPGDMVATLEGPRPVTRLHHVGPRSGWRVSTPQGATVVGERHRLLSPQGWVSPQEIASRGPIASPRSEGLSARRRDTPPLAPWRSTDSVPSPSVLLPARAGTTTLDSYGWSGGAGNEAAACCGTPPATPPPEGWIVPVMLAAPDLPSVECGAGGHEPFSQGGGADWPIGCRPSHQGHDARSPKGRAAVLGDIRPPSGAGTSFPTLAPPDGLVSTPGCIPQGSWQFDHPYTNRRVTVPAAAVVSALASMAPVGVVDCWDLTVAGASHYITEPDHLIHRNCAYDELTTFPENTYRFMFSRLRRPAVECLTCKYPLHREDNGLWRHQEDDSPDCSKARPNPRSVARYPAAPDGTTVFDVPLRMRAASNPGGLGHSWVRDRFVNPITRDPLTVYVPAHLSDNPSLDARSYVESLDHLDPVERARILNGDWLVTEAGKLFQRSWFKIVPEMPAAARARQVRYWDLAATEVKPGQDPDFTVGALVGFDDGRWYVEDIRRTRATPLGVEQLVAQTAIADGRRVGVWIEQEPGASGKMTIDNYKRRILVGFDVRGDLPSGSKAERARPMSSAAESGNVCLVEAPWNRAFLDEAELFPTQGVHDDQVDSVSGAIAVLSVRRARLRV